VVPRPHTSPRRLLSQHILQLPLPGTVSHALRRTHHRIPTGKGTRVCPPHPHLGAAPDSRRLETHPQPWPFQCQGACIDLHDGQRRHPPSVHDERDRRFYGLDFRAGFGILLILATTLTGLGLSGVCRRYLVWPENLVACTLLNTPHEDDDTGQKTAISSFCMPWQAHFCGHFFRAFYSSACHFSRGCAGSRRVRISFLRLGDGTTDELHLADDLVINQLFGTVSGLGMGFITFDWSQIAWIGSPLVVPWWAQMHAFAGFVLVHWILLPILYYTNVSSPHSALTRCAGVLTNNPHHRPGTSHAYWWTRRV